MSVIDLEQKYFLLLDSIFIKSTNFLKVCKDMEKQISSNYNQYALNPVKNKIKDTFERTISYYIQDHFFKNNLFFKPFASPNTSDYCWETNDCILNVDAKTVDISGNEGDSEDISVLPNQLTLKCMRKYATSQGKYKFQGVYYNGLQPAYTNDKPHLTFIIKLIYNDDKKSFSINQLIVMCVLSQAAYQEDNSTVELINNDFVKNFKTYKYITSDDTAYGNAYKPFNKIQVNNNNNLLEFKLHRSKAYFDTSLMHPVFKNETAVRKFMKGGKKCCILLMGGAARLKKEILSRYNSKGLAWRAHSSIKL